MSSQKMLAVIVGSNRGIGLQLTKALQSKGYEIVAACRRCSSDLSAIPSVQIVEGVDVATPDGAAPLLKALEGRHINLLFLVAGYQHYDKLGGLDAEGLKIHFDINAIGPLLMVQALRQNLQKGTKVVLISSKMGSIGDGRTGGSLYGYRMSKAAANCAGATLARDLKEEEVIVGLIHPGAVDTDMCRAVRASMGVPEKDRGKNLMKADDSAQRVIKIVDDLDMSKSGTFWAADTGEILAW